MKNIYLIVSEDKVVVDSKIGEIKKNNKDAEIIRYDLEEVNVSVLIEDLDTYNFLSSKKIIIGNNASFLSGDNKKSDIDHNLERLEKYLANPSPDNILILITKSLDKRKKIVSKLLDACNLIEEEVQIKDIVKNSLDNYQMDFSSINYLIEYCNNDNERILQELEKLKMYKLEDKIIKRNDIDEIVSKSTDDNIFSLIDFIINGKKKETYEVYNELLLHGEQVSNIISKLANKIRLIYQVKVFLKEGKSDLEISKLLKMHAYPIKLARESSYQYSEKLLLEYLNKLAKLDFDIKSGNGNPNIVFETFIASI